MFRLFKGRNKLRQFSAVVVVVVLVVALTVSVLPPGHASAITPPTLVGTSGNTWTTTTGTTRTTGSLTWLTGDLVVVIGLTETNSLTLGTPTATGLTFSLVTSTNTAATANAYVWSATAGSGGSGVISSTASSALMANIQGFVYRGSGGIGNTASSASDSNLTLSLSHAANNSVVLWAGADVGATNDTTVTASPTTDATQDQAAFLAAESTMFLFDWGPQGTPASTSYGISGFAPGGIFTKLAVEIKGTTTPTIATVGTTHTNGGVSSGGNMIASKPSRVVANDLLIMVVGLNGNAPTWTLPPSGGWTQYHQNAQNTMTVTLFYKVAGGSEPSTYTFKPTQTGSVDGGWGIIALRGVDTSTPMLGVSADFSTINPTASFTANSVSWAGAANAVSLTAVTYQSTPTTVTYPAGWNENPDGFTDNDTFEPVHVGSNLTVQSSVTSLISRTLTLGNAANIGNANQYAIKAAIADTGPPAPTLSLPADGAINTSITPQFQMSSSDADNDYLRYKIEVCSTSNCSSVVRTIDQTSSQTGWSGQDQQTSTAYAGNYFVASSTMAVHTYQAAALSYNTQYWWRAYAIDPGGTNTFSSASSIRSFTTNQTPAVPTLSFPADGATGVPIRARFDLSTTDPDSDYIQYKIEVCSTSNCSSVVRTIDQTGSQTGWASQDRQSATGYNSAASIGASTMAVHFYETPLLTPSTQYWWRAYAIDPGGVNSFTSASSIFTFTTGTNDVRILGGTTITGGTKIAN